MGEKGVSLYLSLPSRLDKKPTVQPSCVEPAHRPTHPCQNAVENVVKAVKGWNQSGIIPLEKWKQEQINKLIHK